MLFSTDVPDDEAQRQRARLFRLEELKRVYKQGWRGQKPRAAAMNHVDRYLKRLARPVLPAGAPSPAGSTSTESPGDVEAEMAAGPAEDPGGA